MKYAVVTGGTRGIGKQICLDLLERGYFVFTNYAVDDLSANNCASYFQSISLNFDIIKANLGDPHEINLFTKSIMSKTDKIDCFIGNAGKTTKKPFTSIMNSEWEYDFMVNVHPNFYMIRDLNRTFVNSASMIFIGSLMGSIPHSTSLTYGVSKAALHSLALNLVKEFSDRNIRINVIAPGFVETDWQKTKPFEIRQKIEDKTALKRFATVKEISHACMFLIENTFINGSIIELHGGYSYK